MGLLRLDRQRMEVNMILGVLEEYKPTTKVKRIQKRLESLRKKYSEALGSFQKIVQEEITPELVTIEEEVNEINKEAYPDLDKLEKGKTLKPVSPRNDKKSAKKAAKK